MGTSFTLEFSNTPANRPARLDLGDCGINELMADGGVGMLARVAHGEEGPPRACPAPKRDAKGDVRGIGTSTFVNSSRTFL
jgi:hypothetical protein